MKRIVDNSKKDFIVSLNDRKEEVKVRENSSRRAVYSGFKEIVEDRKDLIAESKEEGQFISITVKPKLKDNMFEYSGKAWYSYAPKDKPDWMPEKVVEVYIEKL